MRYALLFCLLLVGCDSMVRTKEIVVPEYHYVVRTAPAELKRLPPYPPNIPASGATQVDLAQWIRATEERQYRLEGMITTLVKFYEAPAPAASAASK
jgi:hypothetical protein